MTPQALPHVVMLHGVNGTARALDPLAEGLRAYATIHAPDLPGHGGRPVPARMSIEDNAADIIALLDAQGIERAVFVGYSLGGYAATWLARHHPQRTAGVCAVATRFTFTDEIMSHWTHLAQPERIARPGNPRAAELLRAHGPGWPAVTLANAAMFAEIARNPPLKPEDFAAISRPVLLVNGNRDAFLPWSHTLEMARAIPGARLMMFYGIAHPMTQMPSAQVATAIGEWIREIAA